MPEVHGLAVYSGDKGEYLELPRTSQRYKCVKVIVELVLRLFDSPEGRQSLIDIGTRLVRDRDTDDPPVPHLYRGPRDNKHMGRCIDNFLRDIRRAYPRVYLTKLREDGSAVKQDWGNDMSRYDPQRAVTLYLNRVVIDNMVYAHQVSLGNSFSEEPSPEEISSKKPSSKMLEKQKKEQEERERKRKEAAIRTYSLFKYQMFITVAHETIHFLTGYFTGTARPLTPPGMTLNPFGTRNIGESGRYWESKLLGGVVEFYEVKRHILGNQQAGTPYLIIDGTRDSIAREIDMGYILATLNGNFSFPIKTVGESEATTRQALKAASRETTLIRPFQVNRIPPTPSRGASPSETTISYRKLPDESGFLHGSSRLGRSR